LGEVVFSSSGDLVTLPAADELIGPLTFRSVSEKHTQFNWEVPALLSGNVSIDSADVLFTGASIAGPTPNSDSIGFGQSISDCEEDFPIGVPALTLRGGASLRAGAGAGGGGLNVTVPLCTVDNGPIGTNRIAVNGTGARIQCKQIGGPLCIRCRFLVARGSRDRHLTVCVGARVLCDVRNDGFPSVAAGSLTLSGNAGLIDIGRVTGGSVVSGGGTATVTVRPF
jgi:hypothetical protein